MVTAFHEKNTLTCGNCHTTHYSEDGDIPPDVDKEGPFKHLLIKEHSTELCLTCHDGKAGTPDVSGADDVNGLVERAAGFFASINEDNENGHNLALDKTGGYPNTSQMGCIDCHDPHGKSPNDPDYRYRNLRWPSDPGGEPIIKAFVKPGATGLEVYEQSNIGYTAPNTRTSDWREVSSICFDCHDIFKSDSYTKNSDGAYIRHPSADSERGIRAAINQHSSSSTWFTSVNPSSDPEHWANGANIGFEIGRLPFIVPGATNYMEATTVATKADKVINEVFCLTCHKAHGSRYKHSLRWPENSNLGCQQCHNKG